MFKIIYLVHKLSKLVKWNSVCAVTGLLSLKGVVWVSQSFSCTLFHLVIAFGHFSTVLVEANALPNVLTALCSSELLMEHPSCQSFRCYAGCKETKNA